MSDRTLHCYDYVNQPYPRVRAAILEDPEALFRRATSRAAADAVTLHVNVGGLEIAADVALRVTGIEHDHAYGRSSMTLALSWQAVNHPHLLPTLQATLAVFALSPTETQLELRGTYQPPLGTLGGLLDATAGHHLAEASVVRLLREVAAWLREHLAAPAIVDREPATSSAPDPEC